MDGFDSASPVFESAQLETIRQQYRIWKAKVSLSDNSEADALKSLIEQVDQTISNPKQSNSSKLTAVLILLECLFQDEEIKETALQWLATAKSLASFPDISKQHKAQTRFYRFKVHRRMSDKSLAAEDARFLIEHGTRNHQIAALSFLIKTLPTDANQPIWYEQLSILLGQSELELSRSQNARVAANRLVSIWINNGEFQKAGKLNNTLLKVDASQKSYWLHAAAIHHHFGQVESAADCWRKIASSSEVGSKDWLMAKFEIIQILRLLDQNAARSIFENTVALAGQMPELWQNKYDELRQALKLPPYSKKKSG